MEIIDLRSDTVTRPTPAMREAMANAEVGDDVYKEDPTVNHLEELAAERMGKEAGLFVPSGTMGNLAALLAHCGRGDEIVLGRASHTFLLEAGGASALGGVTVYPVDNQPDGTLSLDEVRQAIRADDSHFPITRLVALENTHNRMGATAISAEYTRQLGDLAAGNGLRFHIDGARIFNAAVAQDVDAAELVAPADSVTFCLSKGLAAPVGSVLCGEREFIRRAHRARKQLGGGMRQAGILAAAGIVALNSMIDRLCDDHINASALAEGLAEVPGVQVLPVVRRTNMVYFDISAQHAATARELAISVKQQGILISVVGERRVRLVFHKDIESAHIPHVIQAFKEFFR
ncbi:MAG: low-specificity L-threonine aldolase [Anaerolineales bacterium]|nr:low-specificity L-threonine aldolase [Anaerolineales bacterium]